MRTIVGSLIFLIIIGCTKTTGPGGKKSKILIPTSVEVEIGKSVVEEVEKKHKLLKDRKITNYVEKIGKRIVKVCDRKDVKYYFKVIDKEEVNAFAVPGGYIYVYTGLLKILSSEAELAGVLAHEVSHIVARHSMKHLQLALGIGVVGALIAGDAKLMQKAVAIVSNLIMKGYSRKDEFEADEFGAYYLGKAGYDPKGLVGALKKLKKLEKTPSNKLLTLLSTHPPVGDRIKRLNKKIKKWKFKQKYENNAKEYQQIKSKL